MIKNFNLEKNKYIYFIFILIAIVLILSIDEIVGLYTNFGKFGIFDSLLYYYNTFLSIYLFPYMLLFYMLKYIPHKENIYYIVTRYNKRDKFYFQYVKNIYKKLNLYFLVISLMCIISSIKFTNFGKSEFSNSIIKYISEIYTFNFSNSNYYLVIFSSLFLYYQLLMFLTNLFILLTQFDKKPFEIISIISVLLMVSGVANIGYLGDFAKSISLFTLFSYFNNINIFIKLIVPMVVNYLLFFISINVFKYKEIKMIKGNKQYQIY